jgi:hypothetical protein
MQRFVARKMPATFLIMVHDLSFPSSWRKSHVELSMVHVAVNLPGCILNASLSIAGILRAFIGG